MAAESKFDIEVAILLWRGRLLRAGVLDAEIAELEDHLLARMEREVKGGVPVEEAFALSCRRIGAAEHLGSEYRRGAGLFRRFLRSPQQMAAIGTAIVVVAAVVILLVGAPEPHRVQQIRQALETMASQSAATASAFGQVKEFETGRLVPASDSSLATLAQRRQRYREWEEAGRKLIGQLGSDPDLAFARSRVAEATLKWMWAIGKGIVPDSSYAFFIEHAIDGYSREYDLVAGRLAQLDPREAPVKDLATKALENLDAWKYIADDWASENPHLMASGQFGAHAIQDFQRSYWDWRASLELTVMGS
jgi:hypothetical protein